MAKCPQDKAEDKRKLKRYGKTYTKPGMRLKIFKRILARNTHGTKSCQWSARKAQLLAKEYKDAGGGFKS